MGFGGQPACPAPDRVRCVTPVAVTQPPIRPTTSPPTRPSTRPPTRPTPPPTPTTRPPTQPTHSVILPCLPVALCLVPYGVVGAHFAQYGRQPRCPVQAEIRCVRQRPVTSERPVQPVTPVRPVHPVHPVGPVAPSVQIIGPQPVYVTYNHIKGPTVGAGGDPLITAPGTVESSGVNSSKEHQINALLQALKQKLRNILAPRY